jgi:hypothetical protein
MSGSSTATPPFSFWNIYRLPCNSRDSGLSYIAELTLPIPASLEQFFPTLSTDCC